MRLPTLIQTLALLFALFPSSAFAENKTKGPSMPAFSWDTVPRYMHVRKVTAFTPEEIAHLATFPLITFEKTTGVKEFGSTEQGTEMAAQAVKHLNPDTKILYYRNILVHYDCYQADKQLKRIKAPFLADQSGNTKLVRNRVPAYDLSNKKVAAWWLKNAQSVCSSKHIDGLFVDGNIKVLEKGYLRRQTGAEKKDAVTAVYHQMMSELRNTLGADALILSNIIRARLDDAGLKYLNYFDGSYIEGFEHAVKGIERKDYVAKGIAAIQKAARSGKMIAFTIGSKGYADTDMDEEGSKTQQKKTSSQDRFTYALALFLISAEKHSYFMFTDGFGIDGSANKDWMKQWPELSKPLGPPKGPAHQSGYLYRRSFQNAEVEVNIEDETATIHWIAPK